MEKNGLHIKNWDLPIYRIFPRKRVMELLTTGKNALVHPSLWDDPFENFFLQCKAVDAEGRSVSLEPLHDGWFGQCWTKNKDSDAMWRIYSPSKDGVRVATTIRKLFGSLYDNSDPFAELKFFIGEVQYEERAEIEKFLAASSFEDLAFGGQAIPFAETLCVKRMEFAHENEVRLLFQDANSDHRGKKVVSFTFDSATIIDEMVVDPRLTAAEVGAIEKDLRLAGYAGSIGQSDIYSFTPPTIRLT